MSSELYSSDGLVERGSIPLDIDNVHMLLQVEQEQIQKRTFTNWINAQLAKRRPPCMVLDLFNDFRDGSKLLDLLEVMSGQRFSRERGRGMFQHRSNIEKALSFLQKKSIKLVNINIPDIIDGKPSIILGLIWTIILQYHIEELASCLSFESRQSSMESLASLDTRSTLSSRSASSSPVPPKGSPLHNRFRVSAKKALLLWVREQCHKASCSINVKDFKASWRSGVVFLAILHALRPDLVDLSKARTRSNKQNLEEAFRIAEKELRIPRLLEPDDVDVRDPDEKSIMTYVAQFLQYSRDMPVPEEEMQTQYLTPPKSPSPINLPVHYTPAISASPLRQATPDRKAQEVTCWLIQAYDELLEGWHSTEGESYSERYHVLQTFLVSFNEQRRPIMPLLTAMRRTPKLSEEQRALREAWDTLSEKLREYKTELDMSLPPPLDTVARWLLRTEGALAEEQGDPQDHGCAADEAREKQELLKVCLEEMPQQLRTFQSFHNMDEYGNMMVPTDKMDELKRRFTSVRVTAKYHGIKLVYWEHRHTVLDLLGQIRTKLHIWKRPYISPEAVRLLLQEWHEMVNTQGLPSLLENALRKLKQISEKYSSKSALAADYHHVSQQVKQLEEDTARVLDEVPTAKGIMGRVMSAWDTYSDCLSSLQAWLEQGSVTHSHGSRPVVTSQSMAEWGDRHAHLNEVGNFLIQSTDPQTSRSVAEELRKLNVYWAEFVKRNTFESATEPSAGIQTNVQDLQALIREATLILKEPLETMAGPLRTYRKRLQFIMRKIKEVDLEALVPSPECPPDQLQKLRLATPEVMQTLFEAEQVCAELQHNVSGLDSRLAELLHWETEARELYQLLRATDRKQKQPTQDPRARVIISRGLQLEGQVVTEEQDLQVTVMTSQKRSPLQYLHASAMQERVRAAVAQSQEAIGMLSSLGARRDRSRSPPGAGPPSKVFIPTKAKPQHLRESDTEQPTQWPETQNRNETFVPKIVVQEYREEKMASPPMSYTYAQAVMQTGTKSPPEHQPQIYPETTGQKQLETQEQVLMPQQQLEQQGLTTYMANEREKQKPQKQKPEQPLKEVHEQELMPAQPQLHMQKQHVEQHQSDVFQYDVQQLRVTNIQVETQVKQIPELHEQTLRQQTASKKKSLSSKELQSRKIQGMKNRPWLQKTASGEQKTPVPNPDQGSTQNPIQTRQIQSKLKREQRETERNTQVISHNTSTVGAHPKAQANLTKQTQQQQEQKKQKHQSQNVEQQQQLQHQQQQKEQQQEPHPVVRRAQPDSDTKNKSQTVTKTQHSIQTKVQNQSQLNIKSKPQSVVQQQVKPTSKYPSSAVGQQQVTTMSQTEVSESQSHIHDFPQPHGPVKTQSLTQTQTQSQPHLQPLTCVPAGPQQSMQPQNLVHGPVTAQSQTWAPVRPSSPMQAQFPGNLQPPLPSHIQLRSHPQSWAPVRPPSPKPSTNAQHETHGQSINVTQTYAQHMAESQIHPQTRVLHQTQPQPKAKPQTHALSLAHAQTDVQSIARPSHAQLPPHHQTHIQPAVHHQDHSMIDPLAQFSTLPKSLVPQPGLNSQGQLQAWTQVRASSPMSIQGTAQPQPYPQGYSHSQFSSHQWTDKQESQNQAIAQQGHHIPHPYPQQVAQPPHPQTYATAHGLSQWAQQGSQISPHGFSHISQSYTQSQMHIQAPTQSWAQTQPQINPQSPMPQKPQIRTYNTVQTDQGQVQTWVEVSPQLQSQPYQQPQSQQYLPVQHQPYPQPHIQTQTPPKSQPLHQVHHQLPSQVYLQTLQAQSHTHIQTQPVLQTMPPVTTHQSQPVLLQPKQSQLLLQPKIESLTQLKGESFTQSKPQTQLTPKTEFELSAQPNVQSPTQSKAESMSQPKPQVQLPGQLIASSTSKSEVESQPQVKVLAQVASQPGIQSQTQPKVQSPSQPKVELIAQPVPEQQTIQTIVTSSTKSEVESTLKPNVQAETTSQPVAQSLTQSKDQSPTQPLAQLLPPNQLQAQSPSLPMAQTTPQSPPQARPQTFPQSKTHTQPLLQPKTQQLQTTILSQVTVLPEVQTESPDLCIKPPALAQAPAQAYTEAYNKAQALARNGFEDAKHCLQAHIMEAITVFKDKRFSSEQASVQEDTLRALDPELLEEFLRAAKGMEAFCTPSQLRDMEFFTQSFRTQWEAVRAEISGFLQQLRFEVTRRDFNTAALQCELSLSSCLENQVQACFSADFSEAGQHLEALKELCGTLSPEDAHRLAQTQLMECEKSLAAIQRQFSGDQDTSYSDSRVHLAFSEDLTTQKEPIKTSDKPQVLTEVSQVTLQTTAEERREVEKQASVEEVSKKEAFERYENCKRTLQSQIAKNEQSFKDVPSDSVSLKGLHTRLQEIQFLRQETGSMWSEYSIQCSQCSQWSGDISVEQEKTELQEQWRIQQANLQRRGSSLSAALRQIDSTENHMVDFVDRLDRYLRQPKDVTGFTLANTNILKDIKELDDNIQSELDQLVRLDPESSNLDPRECFPLTHEIETHKASLDQLRQQVRKSEAAARALDRFLMSLRTLDEDISGVQDAPCSDSVVLQDCRSKLALIRQSIDSLKEKAPQLDLLLQGARLTVTRDCVPASCLDMVTALLRRLEDADSGLASQQKGLQKETQSKSLGLRKKTLLGELNKLQGTIEKQGLKEPTMPAVQHKLRALADLEGQLQVQHSELHSLRELQEKQGGGEDLLQELEAQWNETQRALFDRKKQCSVLLELLKKFQTCRSHLSNTIQKAEQTISNQASYMGKGNLQRSMTKVCDIKEELGSLGEQMEEMRGVCKQLQSELKKFPDYSETPFESEADTLMDNWLDITEKTDAYMDNLRVGLELWEKQLMLGEEVDSWAKAKLTLFAESHPFHSEQQVLAMTDEIHANEENISHFHKKSVEIQEMLQSQEAPLELQVMETQMRKRMEQVKELFTDCTDVFEELVAVRKHLAEKIEECQTAIENIQCCLSKINASEPKVEVQIQDLCDDLESQEEQAEAVLKEVGLVSSVASPLVLEELSVDCSKLKGAISRTKDMIHLKREERDRGLLKVIQDERQSFEEWFQDLQLSVNECFENPESRADVETSVKRLHSFLKSKDPERRLDQLKDQLERGSQQVPPQLLTELNTWLKEQQEEVATFRTHCQNRQNQMEALLNDLNSLQKQHDSFREWLQNKEKQSVVSENVKLLLKDLQHESSRAETLSELLASIRRQGVRADNLLKDGDNLIQRYRNLEARLQTQAEAQNAMEGEYQKFKTQAESTSTWISDLLQPITSPGRDMEEIKCKALAVINYKPKGASKLDELRRQMESMCEQEYLDESRKQEARLFVRDAEDQWKAALQAAEDVVHKAETRAILDKAIDAFQTQNEHFQAWIKDQNENLTSLEGHMQNEEKLQIVQAILSSRPHGELKLQGLRQQFHILCDNPGLKESRRQEIHDAVKHAEEQWRKVLQSAEEALNQAENKAASERDFNDFKNQNEAIQSWVREQKQKLLDLSGHMQFEERLQIAQAVMTSETEGESKLLVLKRQGESLCERLEESRKLEVEQLLKYTEQQWKSVLQAARQAELRSLTDDFDTQNKHTESWIRDKQQKLQSVGSHTAPEGRCHTAQTILTCRPEGDFKVNNLRRRGQSLCDHQDADEGRKVQVQQAVKDLEEQWKAVLQAAKQVEAAAEAEISQETEKRMLELREFNTHQQDSTHWIGVFQQQLESLGSQSKAEDRLRTAQAIMSSKPEGDSKFQVLKRQGQSLCAQDLDEHKKQEVQLKVQDTEDQWSRVLQDAKQAMGQAERQCALDGQLRDFEVLRENTRAWLEEKQQSLVSLDSQTDPEQAINTAQNILSCKPEGDSKLTGLKRQSQSLSDQEDLEEHTKRVAQQGVKDSEEKWKTVLQMAENTQKNAEIQYFLSKELEVFWTNESSTKTWVEGMQKQADSIGGGTHGGKAKIEERLNTAKAILSSKSIGDTQVTEMKRRAQSLCDHKDLEKDKREEVRQTVRDTERQWTTVVQAAEETQRQLQGVVERLESCQYKQDQAEARLAELKKQTYNLPRVFPWPGLGERRQVVEQAQALLDQSTSLAPVLSDVCAQAAELFEITQDQSWTDSSWADKESIPALLKELTDVVANLEQGILTERQCTLLIEQHQAAQDWLRDQVKGLGPPPADRHGLHSAANNLKALLQTVDREQREMMELYSARDSLLSLCTPGGQDALTLEVSHLHDLCSNSEQELKEHLATCERRLEDLDRELAKMVQALTDRVAALQWELRSLDQALSYSEPQNNINQLQQHWHSLQNCEKSLEDLGVKVYDLHQEVKSTSFTNELPAEIVSGVQSLCQQHASLKSRLCEHQSTCCSNTASCLQDCLHTMQQWNHSNPSDSISSVQGTLEEGEKLLNSLQEALSHQQFLTACLTPDWFEKLQKESSEILREVDLHKASLKQSLKVLDERSKQVPAIQSPDVFHGNLQETKTSVVAPPRKNKRSPEKCEVKLQETMSLTDKSTTIGDELPVHAEATQAEDKTQLGTEVMEVTTSIIVEQISIKPGYSTSQETKPDVAAELGELGEQMQCAGEEPTVIQKETSQSGPVISEESLPLPSSRKSKSLATETESPASLQTTAEGVVNEPVFVSEQTETAVLEQSEVLPPKRKSKSPNLPLKYTKPLAVQMEEAPESQMFVLSLTEQTEGTPVEEAKLIPIRRKSKNAEPFTASKQVASHSTEVEPEDVKKIPESLTLSTPQVETEPSEAIVVKENKPSPTKRRSKGLKLLPEHPAGEVADTKQEPGSQKPLASSGEQSKMVADEAKIIPARRKSKSLEASTAPGSSSPMSRMPSVDPTETKQEPEKYSASPEIITGATETMFLPPKRKSKNTEFCQSLTEAAQMGGEPEGHKSSSNLNVQIEPYATEEINILPARRKSKTADLSKTSETVDVPVRFPDVELEQNKIAEKSSASDGVTGPSESTNVEKGKLSPTKRKSKSLKTSQDTISKSVTDNTKESAEQKSTEETETVVLKETEVISARRKSKRNDVSIALKPGQRRDSVSKEARKELENESVPLTEQLITITTVSEENKLSLNTMTLTSPVASPELSYKDETQVKLKSESQVAEDVVEISTVLELNSALERHTDAESVKPVTVLEVVIDHAENVVVESQTIVEDTIPVDEKIAVHDAGSDPTEDLQEMKIATIILDTTEMLAQTAVTHPYKAETCSSTPYAELSESDILPNSITPSKTCETELQESKQRSKEAPEQTISQTAERDQGTVSQIQPLLSSDTTDTPNIADYISKLWENTPEIKQRYLVLDLPDIWITQTSEIMQDQPEEKTVAESDPTTSTSAVLTWPHGGGTEMIEITPSENETMKLSESVDQEKLEEFKDHDDQAKEIQVSTHGIQDSPETQDKKSIQKGSEIRILQLDIPFNLDDTENTFVTLGNEPGVDIIETISHSESVLESSAEFQNNLAQTDSAQPNPSESIAQSQHKTEFIEISFYEQKMVKPVQTELLQDTEEKPKVGMEHSIQDEHPTLLTHGTGSAPTSFDEESVTEKIYIGPEVQILQLDIQTSSEEHKNTCIAIEQQPRIDFVQTGNHTEREKEKMTVDVVPGNAATKMTKIATQEDSTEYKDSVTQKDSDQLTSLVYESIQPREIRYIEINLQEEDIVSPSQTETETEFIITTQQRPGKEQGTPESHPETSVHGVDSGSRSLEEKSVVEEKIQMESEVLVLQVDIPASLKEGENTLIIVAKEVPENKDKTTADLQPEKDDTKTRRAGQQIGSERLEDVTQNDSDQNMSGVFAEKTFEEISLSEQDTENTIHKGDELANLQPDTLEQQITTVQIEEVPKTDGDETTIQRKKVAEIQALASPDAQPEKTTDETSMVVVNIEEHGHQKTLEIGSTGQIIDTQLNSNKIARERLEVESDTDVQHTHSAPSTHDMLDTPKTFDEKSVEKSEIQMTPLEEMTKVDVHESFTDSLSEPCVVPKVKMEELAIDAIDKNDGQQQEIEKTEREGEEKEAFLNVELSLQMEQELVLSAGSLQTVEKLSTNLTQGEVTHPEGLSASVLKTEKQVMEPSEGSAMDNIFTEIQKLSGMGAISQLIEAKPQEGSPEAFITSISDTHLSRVVSKVLSLKNCPAELSPTAMARQVEEVQEYRVLAQLQVSLFSQLKEAGAENGDSLEHLVDQWNTAAQDGATVIHSKEAQLELVTDYCSQIQTVKATMDTMTTELDGVKMSPQENSHKEAEQLCSIQKSMEENRTVLGELLQNHTKLCLHLNWSDREAAQTELKNLQERWRALERNIESHLHHTKVHSHQTSSLLSELSGLQEHVEKIKKDLETFSSVSQWNCKVAQQLMQANAEVKAAQQQCQHFQQLSEELLLSSRWEIQSKEIHQWLQEIKDKLCHAEELVSSQSMNSSNPIMEKIIAVMRDGLAWARQTESDIEGRRKRVPLLPEEVYRQLQDLKKLQAEVMTKQGQLESLVEEVTELLPQLDQAEEVPIVHSSLECLEKLSKSTTERLSKAMKEIESGLQTREKLFEQIADLDSWIVAHLQSVAFRSADSELMSHNELDRRVRQIQETLAEAERQAAICEALFMKSKDIASELSVTQTCKLFDKIRNLQEDIKAINSNEKANKEELDELIKTIDSRNKNLVAVEKSLRQILVDLSRHRYPITRESLQDLEPFKLMILEHKSQVDLLVPWIPHEKASELNMVISELQNKILTLEIKSKDHERYLNARQYVEDLKEIIQKQVHQTKEDSRDLEERYKICHTLLIQFPLMKELCKDARSILQMISAELYPSQLTVEQQRLRQNEESLDTWEMTLSNNLRLMEWDVLKKLDLESEKKAFQTFLLRTQQELQKPFLLEPNETLIDREYQRIVTLKKIIDAKTRVLEVLEHKKGNKDRQGSQVLMALKNAVLSECDSQMENICQARECLRGYTCAVKEAVRFLRDIEGSILPPQGFAGPCRESLEKTQQTLVSLQHQFQTYMEQLQNHFTLQTYLSPQKLEQLQQNILSQLLVRVSTLQAKGHVQLECLSRCAEQHTNYNKSHDEIIQSLKSAENRLLKVISQKVTCLAECTDQKGKLRALTEEMDSLLRQLEELREWCPEQSCRGGREAAVTAIWRWVSRLYRCTQKLTTRSKQKIAEWLDITNSVEKASVVLEQVEAELPVGSGRKASTEELQDSLQSWEQYQDRLDCEHRALSALELRTARLLGVPAHLEQAPPTPLCQQLQVMQGRYDSVKQKSREGLLAGRLELEDREKHQEELQVVCVWLEAADSLLSDMEQCNSTQELQEIYSQLFVQKALLERIMERLKMKYSDMYTLVPVEIDSQLQEATKSLEQVEVKVAEAVERSGPVHRLGAKLSDIQAGLRSVQRTLEERSPSVPEAKFTQKRVWDVLDLWHSRLAALEVDMQDLEKPEEAPVLTERLVEVQQLHSLLSKQAEQRTTLLSKIHTWLQEHREMINSSKSWMAEAQSWLTAPCTYTTAKCLSSHVNALQLVLDDAAQIRTTLQGFSSVLKEMSQVCDITALQEQLNEADRQVADVQDSFTAPLSQLEHAAAEVEAIESEVKQMENDVAEIKALLSSPETFPSPKEDSLKTIEQRIQSMRRTIAEIQKCKPGLCLPEKAEETLIVFNVVDQLQTLLMELEKKVPALFIQQPPTPVQAKVSTKLQKSTSEVAEMEEQGQIRVVHLEEDILKRSGGTLQTVEQSSPEQRQSRTLHETQQQEHQGVLQAEEATENERNEVPRVEDIGERVLWWLWDAFLGASPEVPAVVVSERAEAAAGQSTEQPAEDKKDVESSSDAAEATSPEALSKPVGTVRTQSLPESMVNTASAVNVSKPDSRSQQRCVVS